MVSKEKSLRNIFPGSYLAWGISGEREIFQVRRVSSRYVYLIGFEGQSDLKIAVGDMKNAGFEPHRESAWLYLQNNRQQDHES